MLANSHLVILVVMKTSRVASISILCCIFLLGDAEAKRKKDPEPLQVNQKAIQEQVLRSHAVA